MGDHIRRGIIAHGYAEKEVMEVTESVNAEIAQNIYETYKNSQHQLWRLPKYISTYK